MTYPSRIRLVLRTRERTSMILPDETGAGDLLASEALRQEKADRTTFMALPRRPLTVVLDRVRHNYNIGAIFRLCDAFLVERLVIAGMDVDLRKRRLVQAAQGTQRWVPWDMVEDATSFVSAARASGAHVIVVEQTDAGREPQDIEPVFPICLVLGSENAGVSKEIVDMAHGAVTIPMLGMANSINVATAAAITLHHLSLRFDLRRAVHDPSEAS
ncbi:MAG: TrmH family RNA methyltransferase [Pseudomonadota bacterium]